MNDVKLVKPSVKLESKYNEMVKEWLCSPNEKLIPGILKKEYDNFEILVEHFKNQSEGINLKKGLVPQTTYLLIKKDKLLGIINIRHYLTSQLERIGGHIGYGVRPSERKKGYGTEMLRLALKEAKKLGIDEVLITCDKDNIGSIKVILNNDGILNSEGFENGNEIYRYLIKTI